MSVPHPGGMARLAGRLARRVDAGLALAARRNAEFCLNQARSKDLDDARSLRELPATLPIVVPPKQSPSEPTEHTAQASLTTDPVRSTTVPATWS